MTWWKTERLATAHALGERDSEFMRLKVEGILECGELFVAALGSWTPKARVRTPHDA